MADEIFPVCDMLKVVPERRPFKPREGWLFLDDGTWIKPDGKGKARGEDGKSWVKVRLGMGEAKADGSYASYRALGWIPEEYVQSQS